MDFNPSAKHWPDCFWSFYWPSDGTVIQQNVPKLTSSEKIFFGAKYGDKYSTTPEKMSWNVSTRQNDAGIKRKVFLWSFFKQNVSGIILKIQDSDLSANPTIDRWSWWFLRLVKMSLESNQLSSILNLTAKVMRISSTEPTLSIVALTVTRFFDPSTISKLTRKIILD